MPPRLSTARSSRGECITAAWKAGISGAPWPPAATSRRRKSATTVSPGSAASSRPLKVSLSETVRATAGATLTGGAWGGPPCASAGPPQAPSHDVATRRRNHNARGMPRRGARDDGAVGPCEQQKNHGPSGAAAGAGAGKAMPWPFSRA